VVPPASTTGRVPLRCRKLALLAGEFVDAAPAPSQQLGQLRQLGGSFGKTLLALFSVDYRGFRLACGAL